MAYTGLPEFAVTQQVLLVYYSFTEQARIAAKLAATELQLQGIETETVRIDFADVNQRLSRPLAFSEQVRLGNLAEKRQTMPIVLDRPEVMQAGYDLVILFSNTWKFHPSIPVQSFLVTLQAEGVLSNTPFAVVVICRGFWRKNLRVVRCAAEKLGGRFVDGQGFGFDGGWLTSTVQSVRYIASSGAAERRWGVMPLPPFGLSEKTQQRLRKFVRGLAGATRSSKGNRR